MTAVTIYSDFGGQENKVCHCFPIYLLWSNGITCHDLRFFIKRLFSSSLLSPIKEVSSAYLRLLIFLQAILISACVHPAWHFSWCSLHMLNKQGGNIHTWHTPFLIWKQSVVPCPVLTIASWHAYRFLRRQVRESGSPISFRIFHSLLWSTQSKALA